MAYLSNPNKRDREILKFAESMKVDKRGCASMYVDELGNYDHAADRYQVLLVGCDRKLVREIKKLVEKV